MNSEPRQKRSPVPYVAVASAAGVAFAIVAVLNAPGIAYVIVAIVAGFCYTMLHTFNRRRD
jgi:Flp pilus assembly protein TadB